MLVYFNQISICIIPYSTYKHQQVNISKFTIKSVNNAIILLAVHKEALVPMHV